MKTAISVPEDLFRFGEWLAQRRGLSRSEIYAQGLRALMRSLTPAEITASCDEAFADLQPSEPRQISDDDRGRCRIKSSAGSKSLC